MDIQNLSEFIRKIPLLSICTDEELAEFVKTAELASYTAGETIFEQGSSGNLFYIVYSGKIRILHTNELNKEINLGIRAKGDHFGENALIIERPRNTTARATEDSVLIVFSREAFNRFLFTKPELRQEFDKFLKYSSIYHFLKTCSDLSVASPKELQALTRQFKLEFFKQNEVVFRQDAEPDKFYLVESGKLKVVRWEGEKAEIINFMREGQFFGEKALIEDNRRYADVMCLTDCTLFSLSRDAFDALVLESPKLKKVIQDRISSYHSEAPPVAYHELIKQELAGSKKIAVQKELADADEKTRKKGGQQKEKKARRRRSRLFFPFIRQHDEMSCGTTCIMMIAKYYGKIFSASRLHELAHVDLSGSSLGDLASAAEQLGFSTRGLRLDYESLRSATLPCIVHWQGYHYIVVYKVNRRYIWVSDPALGNRRYTRKYFQDNWKGVTLTLEPTNAFEEQSEDTSSLSRFFQFIKPHKTILLEIFIASLMLNLFGLATPIFTQNIIDKVLIHQNVSMLNILLIGMLIVLVFRVLTIIVRQYLIIHTSMKIDLKMLTVFYKHLLALPLGYFKTRKIGDFISRFSENTKIRSFLTNTALTIILDTLLIGVYLSLMFYYNLQLTVGVLIFIPLFILMTLGFTPILKKLNIDSFAARTESSSHLIESMQAIDTVKAMNIEHTTRWKWEDKFVKSLNIDFRLLNTTMYFNSLGEFVAALSSTFILWYGAHQVIQQAMSVGELMAFMALLGSVITPINRLVASWDNIQQTLVSVDRLNDVFTADPEFPSSIDNGTDMVLTDPRGEIEFENVFFRYGSQEDPYILSGLKFKVLPGQTVAIVGRSGSGKTTLVRLIARFYDVSEGKIMIDGFDIRNINLSSLRKIVGFVLQETHIFNASIRENISIGDPDESIEKIIEAAKLANAHDFISGLGQGYDTPVGESGLQLSGGQQQRIAIARVLYNNPKIMIFDEATSSLDTESELAIQSNFNTILKNKTAIVIAHRLSTVRNADIILVLDNGEIIEQGDHESLMAKQGLYHYLNHQQLNL